MLAIILNTSDLSNSLTIDSSTAVLISRQADGKKILHPVCSGRRTRETGMLFHWPTDWSNRAPRRFRRQWHRFKSTLHTEYLLWIQQPGQHGGTLPKWLVSPTNSINLSPVPVFGFHRHAISLNYQRKDIRLGYFWAVTNSGYPAAYRHCQEAGGVSEIGRWAICRMK